jgi:lysophospholipase L1-like esterase
MAGFNPMEDLLNGREYSRAKPGSTYRIGVIGDSITFGNYLPLVATYPKQLERRFKQNDAQTEVLDQFKEVGVNGLTIAPPHDTIHPNELGHRIIVNALFEVYKQDHGRSALPTALSSGQ